MAKKATKARCVVHIRREPSRIALCGQLYCLGHLLVSRVDYPGVNPALINLCDRCAFLQECEAPPTP